MTGLLKRTSEEMGHPCGLLNVNKPSGMSSRQAVDLVKRLVRPAKVGHAGTLDPLACGVLVVCIGKATRLIEFVQQMPKRYRAMFMLGRSSPTEDVEGEVLELADPPIPDRISLERACGNFVGTIQQRPPAFSALKVAGKRAYALARGGQPVALAPRPVTVYSLEVIDYAYPRLTLDVCCGAGTYIRSLGRDLAQSLGTGAVMSALLRSAIGPFDIGSAIDPRGLSEDALRQALQPPQAALLDLTQTVLDAHELEAIAHGRAIYRENIVSGRKRDCRLVALDHNQEAVAVLQRREDGAWRPSINFTGRG